MRAAISRAYYGAYFTFVHAMQAAGVRANWGMHERVLFACKNYGVPKLVASKRAGPQLVTEKLDEMRARRGVADYDLTLKKSQIVGSLGLQIYDGRKIIPLAAAAGTAIALSGIGTSHWP